MSAVANASRWMVAFWVGLTAFWILWLASAPSGTEFVLRAGVLVATVTFYFALIHTRPMGAEAVPSRVTAMLVALAALAVVGIFYYRGPLEKITSAVLAVSVLCLVVEIATRQRRP